MSYGRFCKKCAKNTEEKNQERKPETLAAYISEMAGLISFKCGMWTVGLCTAKICSNQ